MDKFCVFCGAKPESKNKEHILPQWLIKMTGDPNRQIPLGRNWNSPTLEERKFSFSSFTFPACKVCNDKYALLEVKAKNVVEKMQERLPLDIAELDLFLDWLDKVRTGIWLAMIYLNKNWRGVDPLFHIEKRISSKDRFLIIYEGFDDGVKGVSWLGTESPIFQLMPSCFALGINNFVFLNVSYDFLFSEKIGFPYPENITHRTKGGFYLDMAPGTSTLQFPLITKKFKTGGTQLFQPMIPWDHIKSENHEPVTEFEHYNSEYVRNNCIDFDKGKGKLFKRDRNKLVEYPDAPSLNWLPKQKFQKGEIYHQIGLQVGEVLEELYSKPVSFEGIENDEASHRKAEKEGAINLHRTVLNHFREQKHMYY